MKNLKSQRSQVKKGSEKNWTTNSDLGIETSQSNREKIRQMKNDGISANFIRKEFNISKAQFHRITNPKYDGPKQKGRRLLLNDQQRFEILYRMIKEESQRSNKKIDLSEMKPRDFFPLLLKDPIIMEIQEEGVKSSNFFYPEFKRFKNVFENNKIILQNYNLKITAEPIQVQSPQNYNYESSNQQDSFSNFQQSQRASSNNSTENYNFQYYYHGSYQISKYKTLSLKQANKIFCNVDQQIGDSYNQYYENGQSSVNQTNYSFETNSQASNLQESSSFDSEDISGYLNLEDHRQQEQDD
ncbi:hypothetical protein ABPG72_006975 [Tetrahymena utriculariae]